MRDDAPPLVDADGDLLLYDADCGFCTRCARWLGVHAPRLAVRPLHEADLDALGIDAERSLREVPYRRGDGRVLWGSAAMAEALALCGPPWRPMGLALKEAPLRLLARPVYRWVAEHRHRLPGGTAACRLPDAGRDDGVSA